MKLGEVAHLLKEIYKNSYYSFFLRYSVIIQRFLNCVPRTPGGPRRQLPGVSEIIKNGCKQFKKTMKRKEARRNKKYVFIMVCDFYIFFVIFMYFFFFFFLYQKGVLGSHNFKNPCSNTPNFFLQVFFTQFKKVFLFLVFII